MTNKRWKMMAVGIVTMVGIRYFDKKLFDERNKQLCKIRLQRDVLDHMLSLKHNYMNMDIYLKKQGFRRIGIYGLDMLGSHLYEELHQSDYVSRLVGIDRKQIQDNYEMDIFKPEENFTPLDLIIVTVLSEYEAIASKLNEVFSGKIISIQQLINECETLYFDKAVYSEKENRHFSDSQQGGYS